MPAEFAASTDPATAGPASTGPASTASGSGAIARNHRPSTKPDSHNLQNRIGLGTGKRNGNGGGSKQPGRFRPGESVQSAIAFLSHWAQVMVQAARQWVADRAMTLGSSLAYYTLFSLAPLLLFAIALTGLVFGGDQARSGIIKELNATLGQDVAIAIDGILQNASTGGATTITLFGIVMLLFGASGAFVELQSALNLIWKVKDSPTNGVIDFIRVRILSIGAVVAMGFLLLVSLVLSSALSLAGQYTGETMAWQGVNLVISLGLITLVFALVYRLLPDVPISWSEVWGGALTAALLFTLGKQVFSLYLSQAGVTSMYGSAGSVVVVLLWVYYSSLILLFGAEVAHTHAVRMRETRLIERRDRAIPFTPQTS